MLDRPPVSAEASRWVNTCGASGSDLRIRLTEHGRLRLKLYDLSRAEVETAIDEGDLVLQGETALEYDSYIRGVAVHIVIVREPEPARLITVHPR